MTLYYSIIQTSSGSSSEDRLIMVKTSKQDTIREQMQNTLSIAIEKQLLLVSRLKTALLWATAFMFLVLIICYLSSAPGFSWNDARLATVASWLRGYPFYTPENSGVLLGNFYPPLGFLAFLPAALLSHPVPAIITGSLLAFLMNLSPSVGALMLWSRGQREWREILLLGIIFFLALLLITDASNVILFSITADVPAIALMLWGVIFFARWWMARTMGSLAFSAILLGSVVWAKQLGVPLPPTFFLMTLLIGGLRPTIIFAAWSLATLCFWFVILTPIVVDWRAFFFDIWTVPAGCPWYGQITGGALERLQLFLQESVSFLRHYWLLYLLLIALVLGLNVCSKQSGEHSLRFAFTLTASALIAALVMLPFSLLGMVKVGGGINSAAESVQPVLFGLVIGGVALSEMVKKAGLQWNLMAQSLICACLVSFIMLLRPSKEILGYPLNLLALPSVTAYNESKTSNVWFPEFPLSTLLATGHLYHHSYSIYSIFLAGKTVPARQIAEGIPKTPFTLKFFADDRQYTEAKRLMSYLKLPRSLSQKRVGPWQEVFVH
jgi:hypothetical protein